MNSFGFSQNILLDQIELLESRSMRLALGMALAVIALLRPKQQPKKSYAILIVGMKFIALLVLPHYHLPLSQWCD
jgi:hypothetical protein